jgi:hypothetical protein
MLVYTVPLTLLYFFVLSCKQDLSGNPKDYTAMGMLVNCFYLSIARYTVSIAWFFSLE